MIELYSLMWIIAAFTGVLGFLRGWNKEIVVTAAAVLAMFLLFQFDSLLRGTLLVVFPRDQAFFIQSGIFLLIIYGAYQNRAFVPRGARRNTTASILGGLVGFLNGYLIAGAIWYFLDINEYPLDPLIIAPSVSSPSAQYLPSMPMVVLSGGVAGTGDFLAIIVIGLLLLVILSIS